MVENFRSACRMELRVERQLRACCLVCRGSVCRGSVCRASCQTEATSVVRQGQPEATFLNDPPGAPCYVHAFATVGEPPENSASEQTICRAKLHLAKQDFPRRNAMGFHLANRLRLANRLTGSLVLSKNPEELSVTRKALHYCYFHLHLRYCFHCCRFRFRCRLLSAAKVVDARSNCRENGFFLSHRLLCHHLSLSLMTLELQALELQIEAYLIQARHRCWISGAA